MLSQVPHGQQRLRCQIARPVMRRSIVAAPADIGERGLQRRPLVLDACSGAEVAGVPCGSARASVNTQRKVDSFVGQNNRLARWDGSWRWAGSGTMWKFPEAPPFSQQLGTCSAAAQRRQGGLPPLKTAGRWPPVACSSLARSTPSKESGARTHGARGGKAGSASPRSCQFRGPSVLWVARAAQSSVEDLQAFCSCTRKPCYDSSRAAASGVHRPLQRAASPTLPSLVEPSSQLSSQCDVGGKRSPTVFDAYKQWLCGMWVGGCACVRACSCRGKPTVQLAALLVSCGAVPEVHLGLPVGLCPWRSPAAPAEGRKQAPYETHAAGDLCWRAPEWRGFEIT